MPYFDLAFVFLYAGLLFAAVSVPCSGLSFKTWLKIMSNPFQRLFWFPSCPLCWVARGLLLVALVLFAVGFYA